MKELVNLYNDSTTWAKVLFAAAIVLIVVMSYKMMVSNSTTTATNQTEGFETSQEFSIKMNDQLYDGFYANIYDNLVFNKIKTEFEVGQIINATTPTSESVILDIGSGTGHTEHGFVERGYSNIVGIDKSKEMIEKAVANYPDYKFQLADIMNMEGFPYNAGTFTHILCLYFTIYYMRNKDQFFKNCYTLLQPGGFLVVHLVDRNRFDPILPPGNPFYILSPQSYTKERITKTNVDFNGYEYNANFDLKKEKDTAIFEEKFKRKDNGQVRVNQHTLYMETLTSILQKSQEAGFIIHAIIDMMKVGYDYQYLYVFYKPT
jgi:SAM-dependent methyltransferase